VNLLRGPSTQAATSQQPVTTLEAKFAEAGGGVSLKDILKHFPIRTYYPSTHSVSPNWGVNAL
jgi:hypothetical protein